MRRSALRLWIVVLMCAITSGCMMKVAYNNLDRLVRWRVGDVIDFMPDQRHRFDQEFAVLWYWHRTTQLPEYASFFDELVRAVHAQPLGEVELKATFATFTRWGDRLEARSLGLSANLLRSLSDAQVATLAERIRADRGWRDTASDDFEGQRRAWAERIEGLIENLAGRLDKDQIDLIEDCAGRYVPEQAMWEAYIEKWQDRLVALLEQRRSPGFEEELALLISAEAYGSPLDEAVEANEKLSREALAAILASLTSRQQVRLEKTLGNLAQDLRELAAQAPKFVPGHEERQPVEGVRSSGIRRDWSGCAGDRV
ncbi:MAG: DUF6279 family lipoprotein [Pseudomonadales bacterium]|jgi:hypothetical protein|nr:DUF6279 family lipoprotein [Pseudomonadales bacterium]MDP6471048.1 DUF6279 family lipoprotein [Pseudomonadales bacterium]MDP6825766.1 DUF6279 family lipoprotein [Pseudomonadales bacterium]MDP6970240.1 DUF6279 family lipoprotein [Pseudomonadales bacterium]|tara:strand:+ start:751 stop:1689 length:939 start_codon:yes stop_codon:yes gene_type:complete